MPAVILCRCGAQASADQRTCSACGSPLPLIPAAAEEPPDAETQLVAELLGAGPDDDDVAPTLVSGPPSWPASITSPASEPAPAPASSSSSSASGCSGCGRVIEPTWRFCKHCGSSSGPSTAHARHGIARAASDGRFGRPIPLREGRTVIGRSEGDLVYPHDSTLSSRHAALLSAGSACDVVDLGSTNGTFLAVREDEPIEPGDVLILGSTRLLLRRSLLGQELVEIRPGGRKGRRLRLKGSRLLIGKDEGNDLVLDDDEMMSRRHAEIVRGRRGWLVRDLGSTNRTYVILRQRRPLRDGDRILTGAQVFEYRRLR